MESKTENWSIPQNTPAVKKKGPIREWLDALVFALVVATLVRWFFFEPFTIPTPSMEKSLLVGDFLFVSKLHYGARTPKTILQFPLTHQTIWGTNIPSYLDWIQLPQFRLPGFSEVKKGDCVVFNWPGDVAYPTDLKTNYIKRCVGTSGDLLEVRDRQVYINGKPAENPEMLQYEYHLISTAELNPEFFKDQNIALYDDGIPHQEDERNPQIFSYLDSSNNYNYLLHMTPDMADKISKFDFIRSIKFYSPDMEHSSPLYAMDTTKLWSADNYGPILIPAEGMTLPMTPENVRKYSMVIERYEGNENVVVSNGKISVDGKEITNYTFKQNYYWMMGDNRHNSLDSRYWGFVPADHVVGKAWMIWLSLEKGNKFIVDGIRWKRLFNLID
jgi:signal peptidase I